MFDAPEGEVKEDAKDENGEAEGRHLDTRHAVLINIQTARNYTIDSVFSSHCLGGTKGKELQAVSDHLPSQACLTSHFYLEYSFII